MTETEPTREALVSPLAITVNGDGEITVAMAAPALLPAATPKVAAMAAVTAAMAAAEEGEAEAAGAVMAVMARAAGAAAVAAAGEPVAAGPVELSNLPARS